MQLGEVISAKYRLVRLLGDGGMGSVYEAHHEMLGTRVAIKFLHAELARRSGLADRFLQEARVAAQIKSAHVVQVTDIDRTPAGLAYIVMELLEGEPLSSVLERDGKLSVAASCEYTRQILEALEAAHALGVVHRDLKPENVFVTFLAGKPVLKLIDFGIAKLKRAEDGTSALGPHGLHMPQKNLTVAGVLMGTAEYMAPEQAFSADKVDARSDIYSVGVMLYEMIAGARPVSGEDARTIAMKVEKGEVIPLVHAAPEVPREIAGLAHRAMAARPELRFASAAEMRLALEGAISGKRPPTVPLPVASADPRKRAASPAAPPGVAAGGAQMEAGTGTVMGAPAQALLGGRTGTVSPEPAPRPAAGRMPGEQTAMRGGTARVTPVPAAIVTPSPVLEDAVRTRRRSSAPLIVLALVVGAGAVSAIVVSQYDVFGGVTPAATTQPTTPATPVTLAQPSAPAASAPPGDTLAPLNTPPVRPTAPAPTTPRPHPSGGPSGAPSGTTPDTPPPIPPFPSIPIPFPFPSGSTAPVFTIPTTLPSFPPIPFPGFQPQPPPQPAQSVAPSPASSTPGY